MLKADENVIDELTTMSSFSNQHCNGGRGALAVKGSSLHTGKASLRQKTSAPTSFVRDCLKVLLGFGGKQVFC